MYITCVESSGKKPCEFQFSCGVRGAGSSRPLNKSPLPEYGIESLWAVPRLFGNRNKPRISFSISQTNAKLWNSCWGSIASTLGPREPSFIPHRSEVTVSRCRARGRNREQDLSRQPRAGRLLVSDGARQSNRRFVPAIAPHPIGTQISETHCASRFVQWLYTLRIFHGPGLCGMHLFVASSTCGRGIRL